MFCLILQRYTYWLNRGSYLEVTTSLKDPDAGVDGLIVAIVKGADFYHLHVNHLFANFHNRISHIICHVHTKIFENEPQ